MSVEDVRSRKERILSAARKVVDNVNAMSFTNLDDQQVHSLMMMREIARGILCNRVEKVSKNDVNKALSSSIEKMVGSCKDVNSILSKIPCEGMDDEQTRSVSRMKEIASTIVTRRAKITTYRHRELVESVDRVDAETVEGKVGGATATSNKDTDIKRLQRRLFENEGPEAKADTRNVEGRNENQDNTIDGLSHSGNGDVNVQVGAEQGITVVDGETHAVQSGQNEVIKSILLSPLRVSLIWPPDGKINLEWVKTMMEKLVQSIKTYPPTVFWSLMPISVVDNLIDAASSILSKEPNCVEVDCRGEDSKVVVVGDVEGHFHDLLNIFNLAGLPSENQFYVFNGNYVDRGAWGVEVFLALLAWKVLMPNRVYLLRGNHETKFCTLMYGFEQEVKAKYGDQGEMVFNKCSECFKELPLASIIAGCVYTTHGGLFRSTQLRRSKRKRAQILELGSLEDLSNMNRFLIGASLEDSSILTDILWSDPSKEDGLFENADRRMGLSWGPDCTETFLKESKLKLIIRSHQGPDARAGQDEFGDMLNGYSLDHDGESGKMYTLFSVPDYPQFGEPKYNNEGAYAVLKPPNFETPSFHSFKAVERPKVRDVVT
ncbi:Serine/threonine-protein phosphatase 7 [Morus notabilis]|uniref:Serine/threonine-protein phosphatase n=1 Tax=Morus notabilis TaxID=981085 RepID=W9R4R9_9ROSA|nr:Serine/threonine-protein phosphatase 7 [Morus notabilis]